MSPLISAASRLHRVPRYATQHTIRSQNDAEHTFRGSVLVYAMIDEQIRQGKMEPEVAFNTLSEFLCHDIHEGVTGDIVHNVKCWNSSVNDAVTKMEKEVERGLGLYHRSHSGGINFDLIQAADMAECLMFTEEEVRLGNKDPDMLEIHTFALVRTWAWARILDSKTLRDLCAEYAINDALYQRVALNMLAERYASSELKILISPLDSDYVTEPLRKMVHYTYPTSLTKAAKELERDSTVKWSAVFLLPFNLTDSRVYLPDETVHQELLIAKHMDNSLHAWVPAKAIRKLKSDKRLKFLKSIRGF